jgi:hypothetical protein
LARPIPTLPRRAVARRLGVVQRLVDVQQVVRHLVAAPKQRLHRRRKLIKSLRLHMLKANGYPTNHGHGHSVALLLQPVATGGAHSGRPPHHFAPSPSSSSSNSISVTFFRAAASSWLSSPIRNEPNGRL